ncbi:hypothetical protein D918_06002 [Trichuris suis]|nr:hypothetical protein D918_06002 [Trichuris suis]
MIYYICHQNMRTKAHGCQRVIVMLGALRSELVIERKLISRTKSSKSDMSIFASVTITMKLDQEQR